VLTKGKLDDFLVAKKIYHIPPSVNNFLSKENMVKSFENRLKPNAKIKKNLIEKIADRYKVSEKQAEILAMAYRRSIYHPVLLAHDPKLLKAAHELGIETKDLNGFLHGGSGH
jgi:hypothetical protein